MDLTKEEYAIKCINCHNKFDLVMTAHRIDGYLVGWIFVCRNCFGEVAGQQLTLLKQGKMDDGSKTVLTRREKGADWFIKIMDELKNTPEWKDETIDILEGEIKILLTRIKELVEECDKGRRRWMRGWRR